MQSPDSSAHNSSSDTSSSRLHLPPGARLLRALVIGMGILIVIGLAVVLTTITMQTLSHKEKSKDTSLRLPPGARIQSIDLDGGRLLLHLRLPDKGEKLLILDTQTGSKNTIHIETSP